MIQNEIGHTQLRVVCGTWEKLHEPEYIEEEQEYPERTITPWQQKYFDEDFDYDAWEQHLERMERYG